MILNNESLYICVYTHSELIDVTYEIINMSYNELSDLENQS